MALGAACLSWWGKVLPVFVLLLLWRPCNCQSNVGSLRGGLRQSLPVVDAVAPAEPTHIPSIEGLEQDSQAGHTNRSARQLQGTTPAPTDDPYQPRTSAAWPLKSWSLTKMIQQDYPVLPCVNYESVTMPASPACRKRMPPPVDEAATAERMRFYTAVHGIGPVGPGSDLEFAARDWRALPNDAGLFRQEIRIGLSASMSGSLYDERQVNQLGSWLSWWAYEHITHEQNWCFTFCALDDESSKQRARDIYTRFATGLYQVDILLGPQRYEFREDAAMIASAYDKTVLLWSYPAHFYTLALGSTNQRSVNTELLQTLSMTLRRSNWRPNWRPSNGQRIATYMTYRFSDKSGIFPVLGGGNAVVVEQGRQINFGGSSVSLEIFILQDITLEFRVPQGMQPSSSDTVNATAVMTASQIRELAEDTNHDLTLPVSPSGAVPMTLWVTIRRTETSFPKFYANQASQFKSARTAELEAIRDVERSVLQADSVDLADLKFAHTGVLSGPNEWGSQEADFVEMREFAESVTSPVVQKAGSSWRVQGPCHVDAEDCLTSPFYPNAYGNTEVCVASLDLGNNTAEWDGWMVVLTDFDTELQHDTLWVSGTRKFYSGQDTLEVKAAELGQVVWQSDLTVSSRGWQLCVEAVSSKLTCELFMCPEGYKRKQVSKWHLCGGMCSPSICCDEMPIPERNASGQLWAQGYDSVYDIAVPVSEWLKDPLHRLWRAGAQTLALATSSAEWPQCREARTFARELGFVSYDGVHTVLMEYTLNWIDTALFIDFEMEPKPDVLLICGDAMMTTSLITALISMRVQLNAVVLAKPLGTSLQLNSLQSANINYILEPLPWPSVEWMLQMQRGGLLRWSAYLLESRDELANLMSVQMTAVYALLETVLRGYQSQNNSIIKQRLTNWQEGETSTLMGFIRFRPNGERITPCDSGTMQRLPLPKVTQFDTVSQAWDYWYARSLFSEHRTVVNSTDQYMGLLSSARQQVAAGTTLSDDWLATNPFQPQSQTLASKFFSPHEGLVSELVYPKPTWVQVSEEAYPCPKGCDHEGHACVACPPGKYRGIDEEHCTICPPGRASTEWAAPSCGECPAGATCDGQPADPATVLPGYWRAPKPPGLDMTAMSCAVQSGLYPEEIQNRPERYHPILNCAPLSWLCLGGQESKCWGNNTGVLCRLCPAEYSWMHFGPAKHECSPCASFGWVLIVRLIPIAILYMAICCVVNYAVRKGSKARNSIVLPVIRLVFEHSTTQNFIIESMGLGQTSVFVPVADFLTRPLDTLSLDCFLEAGSARLNHIKQVRAQLIFALSVVAFGVLFVISNVLLLCVLLERRHMQDERAVAEDPDGWSRGAHGFRRMHIRHRKKTYLRHASRHIMIWLYITFPLVLRVGLQPFICIYAGDGTIDQDPEHWRVDSFPDISCDDPDYTRVVKPLGRFILVVYLGVLPPALFLYLYKVHRLINCVTTHHITGLFFQGYRRPCYWFEIVLIMRWIFQLLSLLVYNGVLRGAMMVVTFVTVAIIEESSNPFVPLDHNALKTMFRMSTRVHMTTLSMGLLLLLPQALSERGQTSSYVETIFEYQVAIVIVLAVSNGLFMIWVSYLLWYNQAVVPVAIAATSVGDRVLLPFQKFRLHIGKRLHGINDLSIKSNGVHHTVDIRNLLDSERAFLVQGIMNTVDNILGMRNWHVCTTWILQALRASFDMVLKDHTARIIDFRDRKEIRDVRVSTTPTAGPMRSVPYPRAGSAQSSGSFSGRVPSPASAVMDIWSRVTPGRLNDLGKSRTKDLVLRQNALVDEVAVALVNAGSDLQDSMLKLTDFESVKKKGETLTAHHLKKRGVKMVGQPGHADDEDDEGRSGQKYFATWQAELEEAQRDRHASTSQMLLPSVQGITHTKPSGDTALSLMGRQPSRGAAPQSTAVVPYRGHPEVEDDDYITITDESSSGEDNMATYTEEERRAHLRHLILEARAELKALQVKSKMARESHYKLKTGPLFLSHHMPFTREEAEKSRRESEMIAQFSEDEFAAEEVECRGPDGVFTTVLSSIQKTEAGAHEVPTVEKGEEKTEKEREDQWYHSFVGPGGGGPAHIPAPKRAPLPPPVAPPPSGVQRVLFGRSPAPLGDSSPDPEAETAERRPLRPMRPAPKSPARSSRGASAPPSAFSSPVKQDEATPEKPEFSALVKTPHKLPPRPPPTAETHSPGDRLAPKSPRPDGPRALPAPEVSRPSGSVSDEQETAVPSAASSSDTPVFDV